MLNFSKTEPHNKSLLQGEPDKTKMTNMENLSHVRSQNWEILDIIGRKWMNTFKFRAAECLQKLVYSQKTLTRARFTTSSLKKTEIDAICQTIYVSFQCTPMKNAIFCVCVTYFRANFNLRWFKYWCNTEKSWLHPDAIEFKVNFLKCFFFAHFRKKMLPYTSVWARFKDWNNKFY